MIYNSILKNVSIFLLKSILLLNIMDNNIYAKIEEIRNMKKNGIVMETDSVALGKISILQDELRIFIKENYGSPPYKIEMTLKFPYIMTEYESQDPYETITFQLAPIEYVPYSVFYFLEYILPSFTGGNFKRNAPHVLQAKLEMNKEIKPFAFQEYNPNYTHKEYTLGFAGRPSTAGHIYISSRNNSRNHGPGSQGSKTEADAIIGEIIGGEHDIDIIKRMRTQPGASEKNGFVQDPNNFISIQKITLLK